MSGREKPQESPSQTAGPYLHIGCTPNVAGVSGVYDEDLGVTTQTKNSSFLEIRIFDGDGNPVTDAMVELWADSISFWARAVHDEERDIYPFFVPVVAKGESGNVVSNISVWIVARGINLGLHSRIYFPENDNSSDPVLGLVEPSRQSTLLAQKHDKGYRFDIHLQGEDETVFFDV
ncbi:MAG: protocatechuate 3,4-dioxygenase subunit alpha [Pseudomonadota bacterium]